MKKKVRKKERKKNRRGEVRHYVTKKESEGGGGRDLVLSLIQTDEAAFVLLQSAQSAATFSWRTGTGRHAIVKRVITYLIAGDPRAAAGGQDANAIAIALRARIR